MPRRIRGDDYRLEHLRKLISSDVNDQSITLQPRMRQVATPCLGPVLLPKYVIELPSTFLLKVRTKQIRDVSTATVGKSTQCTCVRSWCNHFECTTKSCRVLTDASAHLVTLQRRISLIR